MCSTDFCGTCNVHCAAETHRKILFIVSSFQFQWKQISNIYYENWKLKNDAQSKIQFMYFISAAIFYYLHSIVFQYLSSFHRVRVIQSCQCWHVCRNSSKIQFSCIFPSLFCAFDDEIDGVESSSINCTEKRTQWNIPAVSTSRWIYLFFYLFICT